MGHSVEYVLDIPGTHFADAFPHGVISDDGDWEGEIPGSSGCLIGQTDGAITCLTFADIKYSWLVAEHTESIDSVKAMDESLGSSFPDCRILRIDELLLNQWELQRGEDYRMAANEFDALLQWLNSQDRLHWQVVA